jgi:hypothetical protein
VTSALQWLTNPSTKTRIRVYDVYGSDATLRADVINEIETRVSAHVRVAFSAGEVPDSEIWQSIATAPLAGVSSRLMVVSSVDRIKDWSGLEKFIKDKTAYAETVIVLLSDRAAAGHRVRKADPRSPGKFTWSTELTEWEQWLRDYSAATSISCTTPSIELPATGNRGGVGALSPLARWLSLRVEMTQGQAEYLWSRSGEQSALARDVAEQLRLLGEESVKHRGMTEFRSAVNSILTAHGSEDFAEQILFGRKQLALMSIADHDFTSAEWAKILGYLSQRLDWLEPLHVALATKEKLDQVQRRLGIHRKWILQYAHREDSTHNIAVHYDRVRVMRDRALLADLDAALATSRGVPVGFGEVLVSAW